MATPAQVAEVRQNTDEPLDSADWTNTKVSALIDELGVSRASATIWRKKAAKLATLVNVSEAGSSHALGELQDKALKMASLYDTLAAEEDSSVVGSSGRAQVHVIDRS